VETGTLDEIAVRTNKKAPCSLRPQGAWDISKLFLYEFQFHGSENTFITGIPIACIVNDFQVRDITLLEIV
jgi:hypothetical protein